MDAQWVEAWATVLAVVAAAVAGWYAKKAYDEQAKSNQHAAEQVEIAKRQVDHAVSQDARRHAASLAAWWIRWESKQYGLLISNTAPTPFYDVSIEVDAEDWTRPSGPLQLAIVVPGQQVTALVPGESAASRTWDKVDQLRLRARPHEPMGATKKFRVGRMTLRDHAGQQWLWTPEQGVQPV
ncbi:hypothetical protein [Microbacterium sp. NPDC096154]|uniref:hypothetical protein n=1 Tax=Microbacterium sp. NPDC096154 TaxID=3155549 RepID=UPI00331DB048